MSEFSIAFEPPGSGLHPRRARVMIGTFQESILIPLAFWSETEYQAQWLAACDLLTRTSADRVAFLVDVAASWNAMRMTFAWVAYRSDLRSVRVQNMILWPSKFPRLCLMEPHAAVPDRQTHSNTPGQRTQAISEWNTDLKAIERFAAALRRVP